MVKKRKSFKQDDHIQNKGCIKMAKTDKPLTKDALVSMQVIDSKGRLVGKVKDVAFIVGQVGISLSVENENGETQSIPWQDIQAASDFILLKPQPQSINQVQSAKKEDWEEVLQEDRTKQVQQMVPKKQSAKPLCPTCNQPLTWISQYSRWYCYNDKKYVNPEESTKKEDWEQVFSEEQTTQTQETVTKKQASKPLCPTCNKPLTWIPQYSRWYCYNDKKYV
jgi:sporulation protein YlmC with PRC-barrel domain/ribosomal protein L34E